ncbi:MAG TPA: VOC family protein [Anaerolineales bacterium]|nr:VOC family protein [Anaerolineales bacterium]HNF95319.1 VOC family protein [Anaerolineales bacterium]HNH27479.1 VOC family protein [Anaerolineales bacterium]
MNIKHIHHVAIICSDYERSKKFYTEVLGFTVKLEHYRAERQSYKLDLCINDHYQVELFSFPNSAERANYPEARGLRHLAFAVEDIDAAISDLRGKGTEPEAVRIDELTGKRYTFFKDPDGLPLELYEE